MQQNIYHFNTNKSPKITEVGGKADSLIQMTKMGLPVPEGFVLTVNFFSPWLDELKSTESWQVFLDKPTVKNCELLKEITSNYKFTTEQSNEINKAFSTHSHYNVFSVRSSSPEEDLSGISFAGMYETLLGVIRDQVEESAAKAFASMLDFRVIEYKMLNHIDLKNSCISVIVQRQISSDISGIGFSINTQNNCYDETIIEASFGLGETIVSGNVTPDEYIVEKVKDIILSKKINKKQLALHANKNGGVQEMPIKDPMAQALTDAQILQVAGMIGKCETYYKFPVDTEWAIENDELFLLQARPITTYLPLFPELMTKPGEPKILYMDHIAISQGITDPLSVTGLDIFGEIIDVLELSLFPREEGGLMINIHGRQYINISNTLRGMGLSYTKTILGEYNQTILRALEPIDLKAEYKAHKKTKPMNKARKGIVKGAWIAVPKLLKSRTNCLKLQIECTESADEVYKHIKEDLKNNKPFDQIVAEGVAYMNDTLIHQAAMMAAIYALSQIKKLFKDQNIENEILALGMGLETNPTSKMGKAMFNLATFDEFQNTESGEIFNEKIKSRAYSREFMKQYDAYMNTYGSRCFKEIDIASERNYENLNAFYNQLIHINIDNNQVLNLNEKRNSAYNVLLEIAKKGRFEKKFIKNAKIYQALFGFREMPKYLLAVLLAKFREFAFEIADDFVSEGRLETRKQIFDLHVDEITKAQTDKSLDIMALREKNLAPYKKVSRVKHWPNLIDSRGKIIREIRKGKEGDFIGDPISPGIVRGKAKVLLTPYEKTVEPGEILITKATEPSWTPVFINASGVVLEIGGSLQHGAIIAREYGLPCVSGIINVTEIFKDGDYIEVDGNSGIVRKVAPFDSK